MATTSWWVGAQEQPESRFYEAARGQQSRLRQIDDDEAGVTSALMAMHRYTRAQLAKQADELVGERGDEDTWTP